jgi:hypothetical protein
MRQTILKEMDEQGITIDPKRLTDVNLLKRHILKRCIYGVDLNPMAVELAKVSLWLDCFTLGAPLSFLDHHLRCGNSLIGVTVEEVRREVEMGQALLWGSQFAGLMLATDLMRHVGDLSDVTSAQVRQSRAEYRKASDALAPFKRILDVYTSQWFGNAPYKVQATPKKRIKGEGKPAAANKAVTANPAVEFLKSEGLQGWLQDEKDPSPLNERDRKTAEIALTVATDKRFFHWELEFPEIFYGPTRGTHQVIKRIEGGGFDAVIGNPPYARIQIMKDRTPTEMEFLDGRYKAASKGNNDIYVVFIEKGLEVLGGRGRFGMIVPHKFLNSKYGEPLRGLLAEGNHLSHLVHFAHHQVFLDATTYTCLLFLNRCRSPEFLVARVSTMVEWEDTRKAITGRFMAASLGSSEWNLTVGKNADLFQRLSRMPTKLGAIAKIFVGLQTSADDVFIMSFVSEDKNCLTLASNSLGQDWTFEKGLLFPLVSGTDVARYSQLPSRQFILFPYRVEDDGVHLIGFEELQRRYPNTTDYLRRNKKRLEERENGRGRGPEWYGYIYLKNMAKQSIPKLCVPRLVEGLCCTFDEDGKHFLDNVDVNGIVLDGQHDENEILYLLALINSRLLRWYFPLVSAPFRGGWWSANKQFLSQLPIYQTDASHRVDKSRYDEIVRRAGHMLALHKELGFPEDGKRQASIGDEIMAVDKQIDCLVYELYDLTAEEIRIVEGQG